MKSVVRAENKTAAPGLTGAAGHKGKLGCDCTTATRNCKCKGEPVRSASGRVVGRVIGDVFRKTCEERRHMLRTPPGWSCDVVTLEHARELGAKYVQICARDTHKTYSAQLGLFFSKGIALDRGFGEQLALPLVFWTVTTEDGPAARQLELFSEEVA